MSAPLGPTATEALRDQFALAAMHALMVDGPRSRGLADALTTSGVSTRDAIAQSAYGQTDAMLKERARR